MTHDFRTKFLKFASVLLIGVGLSFFLSLFSPLAHVLRLFLDLAYLPYDGTQSFASDEGRLLIAISGGLMTGWGVMFWLVTTRVYARDPELGKALILPSIIVWFVIDSAGSILAGALFNTVMNAGFLIMFVVPVIGRATVAARV